MNLLPLHRYQFNCRVQTPLRLNFYAGSMLRGAFGVALRKLACTTRLEDCKACMLRRHCAYTQIFETQPPLAESFQAFSQIPSPFVIEPPPLGGKELQPGETFSFAMVLIGERTLRQLPLIIYAWQQALAHGLGTGNSQSELLNVVFEPGQAVETVVYDAEDDGEIRAHASFAPALPGEADRITLKIVTPLRIQQKGRVLSHDMTARDFLMALVHRHYLLHEFYGANYQAPDFRQLAEQAADVRAESRFRWCDWERYSNRQKQRMPFGGVLGELTLRGDLQPFLPLLAQGQWHHVGNKTTFGLGRYELLR
jgi:CRISPR/Cas system endoribonuclease Cas6 (RAMP superfamily)